MYIINYSDINKLSPRGFILRGSMRRGFLRTCRSKGEGPRLPFQGLLLRRIWISNGVASARRSSFLRAFVRKKAHEREKENCEGRALTLEQVPIVVERGQASLRLIGLFEVEHPAGFLPLLPARRLLSALSLLSVSLLYYSFFFFSTFVHSSGREVVESSRATPKNRMTRDQRWLSQMREGWNCARESILHFPLALCLCLSLARNFLIVLLSADFLPCAISILFSLSLESEKSTIFRKLARLRRYSILSRVPRMKDAHEWGLHMSEEQRSRKKDRERIEAVIGEEEGERETQHPRDLNEEWERQKERGKRGGGGGRKADNATTGIAYVYSRRYSNRDWFPLSLRTQLPPTILFLSLFLVPPPLRIHPFPPPLSRPPILLEATIERLWPALTPDFPPSRSTLFSPPFIVCINHFGGRSVSHSRGSIYYPVSSLPVPLPSNHSHPFVDPGSLLLLFLILY